MSNKKIGCAVIGYGGMGGWHADKIKSMKNTELIGIFDINPERGAVAEKKDIFSFDSREALLADKRIELVTIATPNDFHKEIALDALAAGKNVICEKPVAMNSGELEEMIAAAEKHGKLFTVHQNRRWDEDYLTTKRIIDENQLGKVFRIESRVQGSRGIPGDWRNKAAQGGGMVLDWGIHLLDQALLLGGDSKLVSVYAELTNVTNEEVDDGFRTTMIFESGLSIYVEVTTSNFIELTRWYVLGENGSAIVEDWQCNGKVVKVSDWENRDAVPVQAGAGLTKTMAPRTDDTIKKYKIKKVKADWTQYYQNVVAHINGEEDIIVTHDQQRRLMKLVEAIFESGKENKVIKFE